MALMRPTRSLALALAFVAALLVGDAAAQPAPSAESAPSAEPAPTASSSAEPTPTASSGAEPAPTASSKVEPQPPAQRQVLPYDQATPRQTVVGLLDAVEEGRLNQAVRYLDLRGMRWGDRTAAETAELIAEVLRKRVWIDPKTISDLPEGDPADGADTERIASVDVDGTSVDITLARVSRGGEEVWLVSANTVARAGELAEALGTRSWVMRFVPESMQAERWLGIWAWQWIGLLLAVVLAFPVGWLVAAMVLTLLARFAERTKVEWDDEVLAEIRRPTRFGIGWGSMLLVARSLSIPNRLVDIARPWLVIPFVIVVGWVLIRAIRAITSVYLQKTPDDQELNTRGLRTQIVIMRKIGSVAVGLITLVVALMQFELMRTIGWSLLASAGVAGVALGFAAQKSLGAVIAGLQLSVTQPIRLGDAIVVNKEWGEVEEITLTYVRVKLWDERRMIVPVDKFLTDIFENWSKPGDSLTGIVELTVDPTAPVPTIRAELERLAGEHPDHDGRDCQLQVTDVNERRMLLRCRVSTNDITKAFPMRCDLREALMDFLQQLDGGRYLPRERWQIEGDASDLTHAKGTEDAQST